MSTEKFIVLNIHIFNNNLERKPLSPTARRAGWVGCNIVLQQLPEDGRLDVRKRKVLISDAVLKLLY